MFSPKFHLEVVEGNAEPKPENGSTSTAKSFGGHMSLAATVALTAGATTTAPVKAQEGQTEQTLG